MFKVFFTILGFYILYRFIFNFLIPVQKNIKHIKKNFDEMKNRNSQPENPQSIKSKKTFDANHNGEYIDFEEVNPK